MAVAFFFILGGFSLTLGYNERVMQPSFSYKQYITRRCIKFYPLHWLCLIAVLPLVPLFFDWKHLVILFSNVALMQTLIPINDFYFTYNSVSWYLADTMFFAILFPFLLKWFIRSNITKKVSAIIFLTIIYVVVLVITPQPMYHSVLYICPYIRIFDFIFGIILALGYLKIKNKPLTSKCFSSVPLLSVIVFILIAALVLESCYLSNAIHLIAPVYWPLVAAILLCTTILNRASVFFGGGNLLQNKWLLKLGELSFTIFLTHHFILRYITKFFDYYSLNNDVIYVVVSLVLTIIVSYFLEKYVLKYITEWISKKIQASMIAQS